MSCQDCGKRHNTGLDAVRCDLAVHGIEATRERLARWLSLRMVESLIRRAGEA